MHLVGHDTDDWAMIQATTWRGASVIGKAGRVDQLGYVTGHDTDKGQHDEGCLRRRPLQKFCLMY